MKNDKMEVITFNMQKNGQNMALQSYYAEKYQNVSTFGSYHHNQFDKGPKNAKKTPFWHISG